MPDGLSSATDLASDTGSDATELLTFVAHKVRRYRTLVLRGGSPLPPEWCYSSYTSPYFART